MSATAAPAAIILVEDCGDVEALRTAISAANTDEDADTTTNAGGDSATARATIAVVPPSPTPPRAPPAPPAPPAPTPPQPPARASALATVITTSTTVGRAGTVPITLRCTATATPICSARVTLTSGILRKGRTQPRKRPLILARRAVTLRAGTTRTIRIRLTAPGRRYLRARRRATARAIVRATQPRTAARSAITRTRRIIILNPRAAGPRRRAPTFTG